MRRIYLDHLASTPLLPESFEAMRPFLTSQCASPSALHQGGLLVRDALDHARQQVAELLHAASPEEIIFTSGGTESVNLALQGAARAGERHGRQIVTSAIEHPAVLNTLAALEKQGFSVTRLPVNAQGFVDPDSVKAALTPQTVLVATHLANYDAGTIQPVAALGALCEEAGVPLFVDANHAAGWLPVDVRTLKVSLLSAAPHRFYGPKGVGILYHRRRTRLHPILHGGMQEDGRRPGTEHVAGIVGAGVAAHAARLGLEARMTHISRLQARLWAGLQSGVSQIQLNGPEPGAGRLVHHLNVSPRFVEGEGVMLRADLKGVAFASGTACVSRATKASPVLQAMGVEAELALGSILLSPGKDTTEAEIDDALAVIIQIIRDLREMSPEWAGFKAAQAG